MRKCRSPAFSIAGRKYRDTRRLPLSGVSASEGKTSSSSTEVLPARYASCIRLSRNSASTPRNCADVLRQLKAAGVDDSIILAMVSAR
jgi:hypothetical protein